MLRQNGRQLRRLPKVNMPSEDFCKEKDHKYRSASANYLRMFQKYFVS